MEVNKIRSFWNEEWAKVETKKPTNANDYYVSNHGRLKRVTRATGEELLLKGGYGPQGHHLLLVKLFDGKQQSFFVHRLVGKHFMKQPSEDHKFLIHLDRDLHNNFHGNLQWMTREEVTERWRKLEIYKGVQYKLPHVKMTESKVRLLKQRLKKGKTKHKILAKQFNISVTQVKRIESGENWGHVKID